MSITFNAPSNTATDVKRTKIISPNITGHEKLRYTVVLKYCAGDTKYHK